MICETGFWGKGHGDWHGFASCNSRWSMTFDPASNLDPIDNPLRAPLARYVAFPSRSGTRSIAWPFVDCLEAGPVRQLRNGQDSGYLDVLWLAVSTLAGAYKTRQVSIITGKGTSARKDGSFYLSETTTLLPASAKWHRVKRRMQLLHGTSPEHLILLCRHETHLPIHPQ